MTERGLKTTMEGMEPSRSDCHAWGAHPAYHLVTSVTGLRPVGVSGRKFEVKPLLDDLTFSKMSVPHPEGTLEVEVRRETGEVKVTAKAPMGIEIV